MSEQRANEAPGWDDGPEAIDLFMDDYGGIMPDDYEWMLFGSVIRDAVSAYEVYLTAALDDALQHHGVKRRDSDRTPGWRDFREFYSFLDLNPRPPAIGNLLRLRDLLTHGRGQLRTAKDRELFARDKDDLFGSDIAHLTEERVLKHLEDIGQTIRSLDPVLWAYTYGHRFVPQWRRSDRQA